MSPTIPFEIQPDNQLGLEQSDSTELDSPGETLPVETSKKRKADDLTSEMEAYQNADPTEEGKYSRGLWCNRMPFVISSKTGLDLLWQSCDEQNDARWLLDSHLLQLPLWCTEAQAMLLPMP